ncbi:MAG: DegV family protein [Oscillospiraceae bacterium]|jgi:DegV family protein with EDD domain
MQRIKIMTDSACDIPAEYENELGIKIVGFPITVDGKSFIERETISNEEFYEALRTSIELPSTAQVTAFRFVEVYKEIFEAGYTDVINITISSTGSNTYNSALMAKDTFFQENPAASGKFNIYVIDSLTYTAGYGYAVVEAASKVKKGASVEEIMAYFKDWLSNVEIYFAPYSLEQVKRSGRIGCAAAFMGELLGLRPLIQMIDGGSNILEKIRGNKNIIPKIADIATNNMIPQTPYIIIKGCVDEHAAEMTKEMVKRVGYPPAMTIQIGAAVANNAGSEVAGIAIKARRDR